MILNPVLTLLVASTLQWGDGQDPHVQIARIVLEAAQAMEVMPPEPLPVDLEPAGRDVSFFYSREITPVAPPSTAPLVTYDWRSPVIFDVP